MDLLKFDIDKSPKIYYSIGELAKMLNVNTSLVRFWEKEFEILKPKKIIKEIVNSPKKTSRIVI
jgi:DNA-binding transcriptional regulator YiaG